MEQFVVKRVAMVVVGALIAVGALLAVAHLAPAFNELVHTGMWLVAGAFLIGLWRAIRHRHSGADRRHDDRRDPSA